MTPGEEAAQAAIRAAYGLPVKYTGASLTAATVIAIKSDSAAGAFQGPGDTLREISFEIEQSDLPERPRKGNLIVEKDGAGQVWKAIDITQRDDIDCWKIVVEESAP